MRFVLEFAALIGVVIGAFTLFKVLFSTWSKRREEKRKREDVMWSDLRDALSSNSRHRLEDIIILHSKNLPNEIKPVIQSRIDDLMIQESDQELEDSINRKL